MRIIIISDIKGECESVIPYGLHLAKSLESEVDILHVIDSRTLHGVQSSYSDSQTVAPGNKLSHEDIVKREKKHAELELDKLLSGEASRVNYPLKINIVIEEGSLESIIRKQLKSAKDCLLLVNSVQDMFIFQSKQEIVNTIYKLDTVSLLAPPGYSFKEMRNVFLLSYPSPKHINKIKMNISFLKDFKPTINAVNFANMRDYDRILRKNKTLEGIIKDRFTPFAFKMDTVAGSNYVSVLASYIEKNNPDLILILKNRKSYFYSIFKKRRNKQLIEAINVPVLFMK
ncbi:MAG: hypothetical protein R6V23_07415 [Bacteroidales bacterium]